MGLKAEFAEAVDAALEIDFKPSDNRDSEINMFEIIIRYLGGFIGAYDVSGCHDARLLSKVVEVADMAYASFNTPNRMPGSRWTTRKAADGEEQIPAVLVLIAEAASAIVEFTLLSQITGDMRYFDVISRVTDVLDQQQESTKLPVMWSISVDTKTPNLAFDTFFGLGGMADSAFEYLPKMHQLLNSAGPAAQYRKLREYAMDTAKAHTLFRPMVHDQADILIASAKHDGPDGRRDDTGQHLYQDIAWDMFQAIEASTRTEFGNAALRNVMDTPPEQDDSMESFWLAETLKYFYLIFCDHDVISLDDFVFNTEAHPFRIP
ncbi:hypothetical protein PTNB85_07652 [Pyrenophora teres f. teres]|nr:hypothetical protein HRS9139_07683 [Pyrenophora teres f. teres]KAE8831065.1 hypothetical protein PTNB85_07652 [Pyrenophora teres f. teres]KAE8856935.1 hypothetical protein PTNB29_08002 [Pyrenophora teres f. teres]